MKNNPSGEGEETSNEDDTVVASYKNGAPSANCLVCFLLHYVSVRQLKPHREESWIYFTPSKVFITHVFAAR